MTGRNDLDPDEDVFVCSRATLERLAGAALDRAKSLGATDAVAQIGEGNTFSLSVRHAALDVVERRRTKSLSLTVYNGSRRGAARSTDLSEAAIAASVEAAWNIAAFSGDDELSGPLESAWLATRSPPLDLFHPWAIEPRQAAEMACQLEDAALALSPQIVNDADPDADGPQPGLSAGGASISVQHGQFLLATSRGFCDGYASSRHNLGCMVIAGRDGEMRKAGWGSVKRAYTDLEDVGSIGRTAAQRALARLGSERLTTRTCPVLFEAPVASMLLRSFLGAVSGEVQYRRQTFLAGAVGQAVMAAHLSLEERPHELRGLASAPFDAEGAPTSARSIVENGVLRTYLLSAYSARRLGLDPTGHAGGARNVSLHSRATVPTDDLPQLIKRLDRGLLVTEVMGGGVNTITGDYSQGVAGFWVENGAIRHPVDQITVSGDFGSMLQGIVAVGADVIVSGALQTGSVLIDQLKIAGL
jgi:PmbA protein